MNTSSLLKPAGLSLGLLFVTLFSSTAVAGPGPQFWESVGKAKAPATVAAPKADAAPITLCSGAEVVPVTVMKPAMANGKGSLVPVQVGTKTVCHMCPVTTVVTRNVMPNGKGTPITTEVTKVGAEHDCAKCTGKPVKT